MAFTQTQLDALDAAIATGSLEASFDGKHVKYRSLDEMMRIRQTIQESLSGARARYSLTAFTKDSTAPPPRNGSDFGQNTIG
jgi:hypothetical protein